MTHALVDSPPQGLLTTTLTLIDVGLDIRTDDDLFIGEFTQLFGSDLPTGPTPLQPTLHVTILAGAASELGRLEVTGDDLADGAAFLLGFASPTIPFVEIPTDGSHRALAIEGGSEPLFLFRGGDCEFRKVPRWRRILSHFLFLRLIRLRADLQFFHAASVSIGGAGVMLVGPKGAGKTTLSTALASLGHGFLGDETAAYRAADGMILPMRRPVSIKPGLRAAAIERQLGARAPDEDGILHIRPSELFASEGKAAKLRAIVFLDGIGDEPALDRITPGRDELSAMQPIRSSSLFEQPSRLVFAMVRLLGSLVCFRLRAGHPDATAQLLTEVIQNDVTHRQ